MSIYDHAVKTGEEKGMEKIVRNLILNSPNHSDSEIAKMAGVPISIVKRVRKSLNQK